MVNPSIVGVPMRFDLVLIVAGAILLAACQGPLADAPAAEEQSVAASNMEPAQPAVPTIPTPIDAEETATPPALRVIGTEPFWGISVDGSRLHFTTMEDQAGRHLQADKVQANAEGWQWTGEGFDLHVSPAECSDGMSDRRYAYQARFNIDQTEFRGCADDPAKFSGEGEQP